MFRDQPKFSISRPTISVKLASSVKNVHLYEIPRNPQFPKLLFPHRQFSNFGHYLFTDLLVLLSF